jgi:hypothetical protein
MYHHLRDCVTSINGPCAEQRDNDILVLGHRDDAVRLRGPLRLNVGVELENHFHPTQSLEANGGRSVTASLYSYDVEIPAGYTWDFEMARWLEQARLAPGVRIVIRCSPCAPACGTLVPELPCDFAVRPTDCGHVFPVGCEPCADGPIRLPPTCGPALTVLPALGGSVRPRFFNGMFITREDMETQLRYFRIKNQLQRKADGQGVVWGLGLGRDGRSICVHPGYGVDCCGNDLTLTCVYKVEAAALLADPAIHHHHDHRRGERHCYALLLEYVECPEEPRPVHGEPCYGASPGCEMSRVRETVRLRLVPPRECKPEGPFAKFLKGLCERKGPTNCEPCEPKRDCEPFPCLTDPCCEDTPLFSPCLPWFDKDPFDAHAAGAPKAIALAIVQALLSGMISSKAAERPGVEESVAAWADLHRLTAEMFDQTCGEPGNLNRVCIAVQQLLSDLCCALLYPGPRCEHEPHGVVIGCAVVCDGEIERVDPWGGRRWVMHYPLQAYWGTQFGIVPPDILASKIFGMICCLANLERPDCETLCSKEDTQHEAVFGACVLAVKTGAATNYRVTRKQVVPLGEFVRKVLTALALPKPQPHIPMVEVQLDGLADFYLLIPDQAAPDLVREPEDEPAPVPVDQRVVPRSPAPAREWIEELVREAFAIPKNRRTYRGLPLLRGFTERLSIGLVIQSPLSTITPPPAPDVAEALEAARIETVGAVLQQTPDSLAADLRDLVPSRALSELIPRCEARVQAVTEATMERIHAIAGERGYLSVTDFASAEAASDELAEVLAGRLQVPQATVAQCIAEALA